VDITVEDDGPGIPQAERQRVFDAFYRLDRSRDRNTGGFGLGLAIANKAVMLHDGKIVIADSALGGAKFSLVIPGSGSVIKGSVALSVAGRTALCLMPFQQTK
ncbi:MAG: ATP-binding protein, partial [Betaproteobacteria bacterium]